MDNTVFNYNIGEEITMVYGWLLDGAQRRPIKGPNDIIINRQLRPTGEPEYLLKDFNNWVSEEMIFKAEEKTRAIGVDDIKFNPLDLTFPDLAKKAARMDMASTLPEIKINGVDCPVIEHFKDIKEYCENNELFRRWYNRQQFLKYILGTFECDGEDCEDDYQRDNYEGEYGRLLGYLGGENSHYCWCIEIYDASQMTPENLEYAVSETGTYDRGFFLKDKSGKIYFVFTDID